MLLLLNILPLIGVFFVLVLPKKFFEAIRFVGLFFSILVFAFSVFIWLCFDKLTTQFQFVYTQSWLFDYN